MPVVLQGGHIFQGDNPVLPKIWSNGKAARWGFQGTSWDWSNLKFDGSKSSFQFVPDPNDGGLQGDFSIGTGSATSKYPSKVDTYNYTPILYEVEPAGGTGSFSIMSRDLSYWHKIGPVFYSYMYTKVGNELTFNECKFQVTGSTNFNYSEMTDLMSNFQSSDQREYKYLNSVHIHTTDDTTISTYLSNPSSATDLNINFSLGPNNTPESAYTDIVFAGFINYNNEATELFSTSYANRNVPWAKLESSRCTPSNTIPKEFCVLRMWQRPNILYYVHMKFINIQYTDYDNPPSNAQILESWTNAWNDRDEEILVYIEFGVSPNGGKTIWWNGVESDPNIGGTTGAKLAARGITTIVPTNINNYITATLWNYSVKPDWSTMTDTKINRYNISTAKATVHGSKAFKYVRIPIWTDTDNDEVNSLPKNRYQHYKAIDFEDITTSTSATHSEDSSINTTTQKYQNDYWAKYAANSYSGVRYKIGRKYRTDAWKTDVRLDLYYKKDSLKYISATNGAIVTSK